MKSLYEQIMWYVDRYMVPTILFTGSIYLVVHFIIWRVVN